MLTVVHVGEQLDFEVKWFQRVVSADDLEENNSSILQRWLPNPLKIYLKTNVVNGLFLVELFSRGNY